MSSRKVVEPEKQDRLYDPDDDEMMSCWITACPNEGLNLVRKTYTNGQGDHDVALCRSHTSKYDRLIIGPGPTT